MARERAMVCGFCGSNCSLALLHGVGNWRASGGLRTEELDRLSLDEAQLDEFVEGLGNFPDQRTAGHWHHDVVGKLPAELFGDLEAHRLRSLRVVRPQIHIDEAPAIGVRDLRAQAIHLVIISVDANHARAIDLGIQNFCRLKIGGDEDARVQSGARGLRRNCVRQISGGRAAYDFKLKSLRCGERDGDDAVFERQGWKTDGVVFYIKIARTQAFAKTISADERREACGKIGVKAFGQRQ